MIYGGWRHCNIARLKDDFTGFDAFCGWHTFKEITPKGYVEGPFMFITQWQILFYVVRRRLGRAGLSVAYAIADSPFGPFKRIGKILQQDTAVATGAGHHSIIQLPGTDQWYIVYHRRPLTETAANNRVVCIDEMYFDKDGLIIPVKITKEGVTPVKIK